VNEAISILADAANDRYWSKYDWARPFAEEEVRENPDILDFQKDYRQYLPLDPTHPRAYIPAHVRWAKRKSVDFRCPITGWSETDWYRGIGGGPFRRVGLLTMDHIIPGAAGGQTTDENIRAICSLANTRKGSKQITDEELRRQLSNSYKLIEMPKDLLEILNKYAITQYKVGI
jgi:hypothetical protein